VTTRIKVCCIETPAEAGLARKEGADVLGLVSSMPSGPGVISEDEIASIVATTPRGTETYLLTSLTHPDDIAHQHNRCATTGIQLCDRLPPGIHRRLRDVLGGVTLVQVIHVTGDASVHEAVRVSREVDFLLLDSGRPNAPTRELGGTGRIHDWEVSRRIRESVDTPVFLAGGLTPENVGRAVETVRPYGVDVCSGVRGPAGLDGARLHAFVGAVRAAG